MSEKEKQVQLYSDVDFASSSFYKDAYESASDGDSQLYIMSAPWVDRQFRDPDKRGWVLLKPGYPITFVREANSTDTAFEEYVEDFKEDLWTIVTKYKFAEKLGRMRTWPHLLKEVDGVNGNFSDYLRDNKIADQADARKIEVIVSLLIGSINNANELSLDPPETMLAKVKQKIILFDTDQTRFLYQDWDKNEHIIRIQGLAGTGKTELLLHKIKDIYINDDEARICFTCHNRVLASVLRKRLVSFFDAMQVSKQIDPEHLMCVHAWGSYNNPDSGTLRKICDFYNTPFYALMEVGSFDAACRRTIENIKKTDEFAKGLKAFTYMFIDESQDFPKSFFELCEMVTEKRLYVAGDIFQNIFTITKTDDPDATPNILLNRCYRTDPRTFMFAHGMGLALFEPQKLDWLSDGDWVKCGYSFEKTDNGARYIFTRKPVSRFIDIPADFKSTQLYISPNFNDVIKKQIDQWQGANSDLGPGDIAVILLDEGQYIYDQALQVGEFIKEVYGWDYNLAYRTKSHIDKSVFISNRNNVKGLEFPYVICLTREVKNTMLYRHTLYTMLSRSHLQSVLVVSQMSDALKDDIIRAGNEIMETGHVTVTAPTEEELKGIRELKFEVNNNRLYSLEERVEAICEKYGYHCGDVLDVLNTLKQVDYSDEQLESKVKAIWALINGN